ncbi:hypothetical protein [Halovenus aranensis]|jgi:ferrous iron transport protein B|nr:hypothetical protein [Halovenus aranensis]
MSDTESHTDNVPSTGNGGKETVVGKSGLVVGLPGTTPTTRNFRRTIVDV